MSKDLISVAATIEAGRLSTPSPANIATQQANCLTLYWPTAGSPGKGHGIIAKVGILQFVCDQAETGGESEERGALASNSDWRSYRRYPYIA
jgi:hypothetical protein